MIRLNFHYRGLSLGEVIADVCRHWGLEPDENAYGLKFDKTKEYVTEASVRNIKYVRKNYPLMTYVAFFVMFLLSFLVMPTFWFYVIQPRKRP